VTAQTPLALTVSGFEQLSLLRLMLFPALFFHIKGPSAVVIGQPSVHRIRPHVGVRVDQDAGRDSTEFGRISRLEAQTITCSGLVARLQPLNPAISERAWRSV